MIAYTQRFAALTVPLVLTLLSAVLVAAQELEDPEGHPTGWGAFQTGVMRLDPGPLNASLADANYPGFERDFLTLGGSGYGVSGRFLVGGEGHGFRGPREATPDGALQLSAGGGYGLLRLGYLAVSTGGFDVFPVLGIGGGAVSVELTERSAPTFGEVLADPNRSSRLSSTMFALDGSIAGNYRVFVPGGDEEEGGLLVGIQAGYTFSPGTRSWELDGLNDVAGGPDFKIQGAHLRISIGGWGRQAPPDP